MGKLKKPSKNAYFFFIMAEKDKAEAAGCRVSGGFGSFSQAFGYKWSQLTKEEKAPYERMAKEAKEEEKYNVNNKYTITGESYAQVHRKQMEEKSATEEMEYFIQQLASGPTVGDRMFIFMKAVYSVEEIISKRSRLYWPSELSMAAFSLNGGIRSMYTQLVDTVEPPTGYASQAKENCEETMLPMPGNKVLLNDESRDYERILRNVNGFVNHWLKDGYVPGHKKVLFALDSEIEPIRSCLQWLVENVPNGRTKDKFQRFVNRLKVYKISKLILSLAEEANRLNPAYDNYLVQFKLSAAAGADAIVTKGNYDYREEIACVYHRLDFASVKMHNCAQSIVIRRIFMLFEEFIPGFEFQWTERHRIETFGRGLKGPIIKKKREKSPAVEEKKVEEPSWLKSDDVETWDYSTDAVSGSTWGTRPSVSPSFEKDDFPALGACGGVGPSRSGRSKKHSSSTSSSQSPPHLHYGNSGRDERGASGGYESSIRPPVAPTRTSRNFMDDDDEFPSLSSAGRSESRDQGYHLSRTGTFMDDDDNEIPPSSSAPRGGGGSTGRGYRLPPSSSAPRNFMDDDDDFPPLGAAGRGRGRMF